MRDSAGDLISPVSKISELDLTIYSFIWQISIERLLPARHYARHQGYRLDGQTPCPRGAYSLVGGGMTIYK